MGASAGFTEVLAAASIQALAAVSIRGLSASIPGFHPFLANRRFVFHRGFFRNGVFVNGWWGPAVVTTAWWGGYDSCWVYRPTYDASGNYLGYSYVNLCS